MLARVHVCAPRIAPPTPARVAARRAVAAPAPGRGRLVVSAKKDSGKDSGKKKDKAEAPAEPHAEPHPAAPEPAAAGGGNGGEPKAPKTKTGTRTFDPTKPCAPPRPPRLAAGLVAHDPNSPAPAALPSR